MKFIVQEKISLGVEHPLHEANPFSSTFHLEFVRIEQFVFYFNINHTQKKGFVLSFYEKRIKMA
jgi:hypothetical protein